MGWNIYDPAKGGTGGGGIPNPDAGSLADNEMVKANVGGTAIVGTGDINSDTEVDFGAKDIRCKSVITEDGSVDVGPNLTISERGGYLQTHTNTTDRDFISVDYEVDDTGTQKPTYDKRAALDVREVIQPDDSQQMFNVTSYAVTPANDNDVIALYAKFINPVTNFRFKVVSDVTGLPIKYYPSQNDWDKGTGTSFSAGEQRAELATPLAELTSVPITVFAMADQSIDVLGDGVNPWRAIDRQLITYEQMITDTDYAVESLSTSLISTVTMTQNTTTSIDIPAGNGRLFDKTLVSWAALTNVAITNIATTSSTVIAIDGVGDVQQLSFPITSAMVRDYIILGYVVHPTGTLTDINNAGFTSTSEYSQILDLLESLGVVRKSGLKVNANADLTFAKTAGEVEVPGGGVATGNRGPNRIAIAAESPCTFARLLGITTTDETLSTTLIDPGFYDTGTGTKVAVPTPAGNSTIQYVYQSIDNPAGGVVVMYGQTIYSSLDAAVLNAFTDSVQLPVELEGRANLIARIAVNRTATDLTNTAQAVILSGVKFGAALTGLGFGQVGGGGDVFGPASSPFANIVPAFGDTSGKTLNAASDIRMNSGGIIRNSLNQDLFLNTQIGGWIRVNEASAASTGIRIALQNSVRGTYGFDGPADSLVMQHGNTTTVPSDKDTAYFAMTGGGRHEMGTQRLELVRETEQTMQLLFTTGGTNRAGMHYISGTSFNLRFGANPDPTGMDIFIDRTQFNHPIAPKSYTTAERDALVLTNIPDGAIIEHSTASRLEEKRGAAWVPVKGLGGPTLFVNNATIAVPASADFTVPSGAAQFYEDDGATGTAPFVGGVFTAPKAGVYSMSFGGLINRTTGNAGDTCDLWIAKNDASFVNSADTSLIDSMLDYTFYSTKWTGRLAVGDTLRVKSTSATATWNLENLSISITTEYQD